MKLWLVRHARPLVDTGVCYGVSNIAADAGHTQARAALLAAALPPGLAVWHSPLQRCAQLARALHVLRPDLRLRVDERLAEMDFGCWEGVRWDEIARQHYDAWTADFGAHRFGGRESVNDLVQRVRSACADGVRQRDELVWITHAGVMRSAMLLARGVTDVRSAQQWPQEELPWGEWVTLDLQGAGVLGAKSQ